MALTNVTIDENDTFFEAFSGSTVPGTQVTIGAGGGPGCRGDGHRAGAGGRGLFAGLGEGGERAGGRQRDS